TAADVGDVRAGPQFCLHTLERRNPALDQVGRVARAEEALDAVEELVVMLMPADAPPGQKRLGQRGLDPAGGQRRLKRADHKHWAALGGNHQRLLRREAVASGLWVVGDIAAGGVGVEPFVDVTLGGARACCQFGRRLWLGSSQRFVQSELVADQREGGEHRCTKINNDMSEQLVQFFLIDSVGHHHRSSIMQLTVYGCRLRVAVARTRMASSKMLPSCKAFPALNSIER